MARAHGTARVPQTERSLGKAVRPVSRRPRSGSRLASTQGDGDAAVVEPVRLARVPARADDLGGRTMDRRDVPSWPDRASLGKTARADLGATRQADRASVATSRTPS